MAGPGRFLRCAFLTVALLFAAVPDSRAISAPNPSEPSAQAVSAEIDRLVSARLSRLGIQPAPVCSDEVFLRRVHLDVIATLPTAEEARAFLADRSSGKRAALIDAVLARDEYADTWAMKWCNLLRVKSEFPINLWPNAVQAYHRWIRAAMAKNEPFDRFAKDLLTANGSNFRVPEANFWRAVQGRDPATLAKAVALTFMGVRAEKWPKEKLDGMTAFFARVGYKTTAEWKEEIVFWDLAKADAPAKATFPDGPTVTLSADQDPRETFANWLVSPNNPWFARAIANRVWSWLFGRGIVHEPDDFRPDNPPSNPELLSLLEKTLVGAGWDVKRLFRAILGSQTYQRASSPAPADPRAESEFACYSVRRLEAEVLIDAINQVTGTTEEYVSKIPEPFTVMPTSQRAVALPDSSVTSPFLELFGRSSRDTGYESEQRASLPTAAQVLHMLNSSHVRTKIEQGPGLRAIGRGAATPLAAADTLYLAVLSRHPSAEDLKILDEYSKAQGRGGRGAADIAWALFNSTEFQYRH